MIIPKVYDQEQIECFVNGFVQGALFGENDDAGDALDSNFSGGDIDPDSFARIKSDCLAFLERAGDLLDSVDLEQSGTDFYYVRNGHGVGFLDRDIDKSIALDLTNIAHRFPSLHFWAEHGEVYCE